MFFKRKATGEGSMVVTADSKAWFKAEFDPIGIKMTILFQADSDFLDFLTANMITLAAVDFCRVDLNLEYIFSLQIIIVCNRKYAFLGQSLS